MTTIAFVPDSDTAAAVVVWTRAFADEAAPQEYLARCMGQESWVAL